MQETGAQILMQKYMASWRKYREGNISCGKNNEIWHWEDRQEPEQAIPCWPGKVLNPKPSFVLFSLISYALSWKCYKGVRSTQSTRSVTLILRSPHSQARSVKKEETMLQNEFYWTRQRIEGSHPVFHDSHTCSQVQQFSFKHHPSPLH